MENQTQNTVKCLMIKDTLFIMDEQAKRETEKSLLLNVCNTSCGSNKDFWIPKSLIKIVENENNVKMYELPTWFIQKSFTWIN